jgi:4a-hydroxytetrahydrobiopterin dehydratase
MPKLTDDQITEALASLQGWERVGDELVREYELPTFPAVIDAVVRIGGLAEEADHHPDLDIRYRRLRVALTTHDQGGLTAKDVSLARQIDGAVASGS